MKAIIENGKTYKVISERGSFTVCEDSKGKCKMFQTSTIEVVEINEIPKEKVYKQNRTSEEKRAEKMSVTASRPYLTQKEKEYLEDYMQAKKWNSVSW
jgi:hypothetical protein